MTAREPVRRLDAERPLLPIAEQVRPGSHLGDGRPGGRVLGRRRAGADDGRLDADDSERIAPRRQCQNLVLAGADRRVAAPVAVATVREQPAHLEAGARGGGRDRAGVLGSGARAAIPGVQLQEHGQRTWKTGDGRRKPFGALDGVEPHRQVQPLVRVQLAQA